jgi:hypothetical protein
MTITTDEAAIAKNHRATPAPPAGPRITRREVWVDIGDEYEGFKAKLTRDFVPAGRRARCQGDAWGGRDIG